MLFKKFQGSQSYYYIGSVFKSILPVLFGNFKRGEVCKQLERKLASYFNVKSCYMLSSARISLYYILKALELPENSEVLMTPITIADMVNMIASNGLKPKFVEMDKETINFDIEDLEKKITKNSRVLFITYLYGIVPHNIEKIFDIAKKNNLLIIEDVSQSIGVTYKGKMLGTMGDFGICSFSSFKTISTLYGGVVISDKSDVVEKISKICEAELEKPKRKIFFIMIAKIFVHKFFMWDPIFSLITFPLLKLVNKIDPTLHYKVQTGNIGVILGLGKVSFFNKIKKELLFHFTDFQAKMGLKALKNLQRTNESMTRHAQTLLSESNIKKFFPKAHKDANMIYWRFPLYIGTLKNIKERLFKRGIETSLNSLPVCSEEECFKQFTDRSLKNAIDIHKNYLLIPFHGWFSDKKVVRLKKLLSSVIEENKYLEMIVK